MRKPNPREFSWIPLVDLLFNMLAGFLCLFAIAMITQGKPAEGNVTLKGEFIVQMTWQEESTADVDLWVMQPDGMSASYVTKDIKTMTLDRDNLGSQDNLMDTVTGQKIRVKPKSELTTIRGVFPGWYTVGAFLYSDRPGEDNPRVYIQVFKLNPYQLVYEGEKFLSKYDREKTFVRFMLDKDGNVMTKDEFWNSPWIMDKVKKRVDDEGINHDLTGGARGGSN